MPSTTLLEDPRAQVSHREDALDRQLEVVHAQAYCEGSQEIILDMPGHSVGGWQTSC